MKNQEIPKKNFWRHASLVIEDLLKNSFKPDNNDLINITSDDFSTYKEIPQTARYNKPKHSFLDKTYKTYNPHVMTLIERAKRFHTISDERKITHIPHASNRTISLIPYNSFKEEFKVSGKKIKTLLSLPECNLKPSQDLDLSSQLKSFISKVKEKYSNFAKFFNVNDEFFSFDSIGDYLKKTSSLLKRPSYSQNSQRAPLKFPRFLAVNHSSKSSNFHEKISLLRVTFT